MHNYESLAPLLDRVLVKRSKNKAMYVAGTENWAEPVVIPENQRKAENKGEVVAIGTGVYMGGVAMPIPVSVGDIVHFTEFGPEELKLNGEEYLSIRVADLKAVERKK